MRKIILFCLVLVPHFVFADTSSFLIDVLAGEDLVPPSEPSMLQAVPVASNQIDITWSTSTDDVFLYGYVVLRDAVPIATTTLTTYSDTSLAASTTYAYSVYAFDGFFNQSTTSNSLATTTLPAPVTPPSVATTTTQATLVFRLQNFALETTSNAATLSWQTSKPARYELRWGRNDSYDDGYVVNDIYRQSQTTTITDLEPGTTYLYELVGYDASGQELPIRQGSFVTKSGMEGVPSNVQNLYLEQVATEAVKISFDLPVSFENRLVRIVRNYWGYPQDPFDGAIVFEGVTTELVDTHAFKQRATEFYAVFVVGEDGTFSSGAVAKITSSTAAEEEPISIEEVEEVELVVPGFEFTLKGVELIQGEQKNTFADSEITLDSSLDFLVRIPLSAVPDSLKSIVVTITDPTNSARTYSFLLRLNKDRTAYEALLAPLGVSGASLIMVEVYDYERKVVGRYKKSVEFIAGVQTPVIFPDVLVKTTFSLLPYVAFASAFSAGTFFWFFLRRRRGEDNR